MFDIITSLSVSRLAPKARFMTILRRKYQDRADMAVLLS